MMSKDAYIEAIITLLNGPKFSGRLKGHTIEDIKAERVEGRRSFIRLIIHTDKTALGIWPTEMYLDHIGLAPRDLKPPKVNPNRDPEDSPMFSLKKMSFKIHVATGGKDYDCLGWDNK